MPLYTKESLETLRQRINLIDVLDFHLDLKRSGASYKCLCPFHDEKSPSFVVQKGDTHFHCFGCGAHGDAIQFLMMHQRYSFTEAVESLADRFQVVLEVSDKEEKSGPNKGAIKEALNQATAFFHMILLHTDEGHEALRYLYSRGISLDFIKKFHLGLAPKQSMLMRKTLNGRFIKDETMVEAGLLSARYEGGFREFFSDRITIPIRDPMGFVIGFSARKYKEETFGGKYVNTSETPLFKKSRILFGLNFCRRRISKERKALIVEGQLDALRLIEAGFNITVAGQGTAFGEGHAKELIALGVREIFLALDSDDAGQEAIVKIGDLFQKEGVEVSVIQLPIGDDPDLFLRRHGADGFLRLMEGAVDYLTFLVGYRSRFTNTNSPAGKSELVREIASQIRNWNQPLMIHESLRKLAHLAQVPEEVVGHLQDQGPNLYVKKAASIGRFVVDPDRVMEGDVLVWLLLTPSSHPHFYDLVRHNLSPHDFHIPQCRLLYEALLSLHLTGKWDFLTLISLLEDEPAQQFVHELLQKKVNRDRADELIQAGIKKMLDRNWMEKREKIKMKIQSGECSEEEAWELLKAFDVLKKNPPEVKLLKKNEQET